MAIAVLATGTFLLDRMAATPTVQPEPAMYARAYMLPHGCRPAPSYHGERPLASAPWMSPAPLAGSILNRRTSDVGDLICAYGD